MTKHVSNSTSTSLKHRLKHTDAHVVFACETGITKHKHGDVIAEMAGTDWKFLHSPAFPATSGANTSCGVAVFARSFLGLRHPPSDARQGVIEPGRLLHVALPAGTGRTVRIPMGASLAVRQLRKEVRVERHDVLIRAIS